MHTEFWWESWKASTSKSDKKLEGIFGESCPVAGFGIIIDVLPSDISTRDLVQLISKVIVRVVKSRILRWPRHVGLLGEGRNVCIIQVGKLLGSSSVINEG